MDIEDLRPTSCSRRSGVGIFGLLCRARCAHSHRPVLTAPWFSVMFMYHGRDSKESGFTIDPGRVIARDTGHERVGVRYDTIRQLAAALASGEVDWFPGVPERTALAPNSVFSDTVAQTGISVITRATDGTDFDIQTAEGFTVGTNLPWHRF